MTNIDATAPALTAVADGILTADIDNGGSLGGSDKNWRVYPPAGTGINLDLTVASTGGYLPDVGASVDSGDGVTTGETNFAADDYIGYTIGTTFVYDGYQESPIYEMPLGHTSRMTATYAGLAIDGDDTSTGSIDGTVMLSSPYDNRITGSRVYCRHTDDQNANWFLMWDIDFAQGARTNMTTSTYVGTFALDTEHGKTNDVYLKLSLPTFTGPLGETYFSINGYHADENIDIRYKTSAIVSGRVFAGNVYREVDGKAQVISDRIYYTPVSTYSGRAAVDVFPESLFLENSSISDPIVKLIGLGNQLLVFGMEYLTIWTLGAATDTVTGTFAGYGIAHPSHVVTTPNGVVFANNAGIFLYNGQAVMNLLYKRGDA